MMISKERLEMEMVIKMREIIALYKRYNPNGTYLTLSFLQTEQDKGRVHINNAYTDRDHGHKINLTEDIKI